MTCLNWDFQLSQLRKSVAGNPMQFTNTSNNNIKWMCFISTGKEIQAISDAWFLGDDFLQETYHQFQKVVNIATMKKKDISPPYLTE